MKTVNISPGTSLAALKSNMLAAMKSNPTGDLELRVFPANAKITDGSDITLSASEGFSGARAVILNGNGLTLAGGQPNIDKPASRLPVFVETIPGKGQPGPAAGIPVRVVIRDSRFAAAPAAEKALLAPGASKLSCQIRMGWYEIRTTLINPVRAGASTVWDVPPAISDYLRPIWSQFSTQEEYVFEGGAIYASYALKPLFPQSVGTDWPAVTFKGTKLQAFKNFTMKNVTIRDRALGTTQYILDQQNDTVGQGAQWFAGRWLPSKGLSLKLCENVTVSDCVFYNLDGQACTLDVGSRDCTVRDNMFQEIGGQALSKGVQFNGDDYFDNPADHRPYGDICVFSSNGFYRTGQSQFGGAAIFSTAGNLRHSINRNLIQDCGYSGIAVGYPFANRGTFASPQYYQNQLFGVSVTNNLIQNVMTCSVDGGGIYTKGPMVGGAISGNTVRLVGPSDLNHGGASNNFYGSQVGVGPSFAGYPAPIAHIYHDNGSFGWVNSGNVLGPAKNAYQPKLFLQLPIDTDTGAQLVSTGEIPGPGSWGAANGAMLAPPAVAGIVQRKAWFALYGN